MHLSTLILRRQSLKSDTNTQRLRCVTCYSYQTPTKTDIDQFGWFGVPTHPLNFSRVFAITVLIVAIALTQLDRQHSK
ncbi:DMT family transporter [Oscillatoria sp. FACHB-1407]|nr:DMT family transporter [Oscillatoria sp. FACHB-1407]